MRRASSVLLFRTLAAARAGSATSIAVPNRFIQATLYGTTAGSSPSNRRWFSSILAVAAGTSLGVGGALIAASSVSHEALAKEPPPSHALPNDVVLYQYEACPFCNKVKGRISDFSCLYSDS
jgi:microsomal prostaglandin-E synthase 2